jgi:biotin carboxylase
VSALVVVGLGFPQLGLLRAARELGVTVWGLDQNPEAVGAPLADHFLKVSTGDPDAVAAAVAHAGATAITTTGSELALTTTAAVAERLGLPFYADTATIHRCQAKDAMRAAYAAAGLPVPRFVLCSSTEEATAFVARVGLPVVVKPAHGWGQRGVSRVDLHEQLAAAVEAAAAASHGGGGAVVEEHMAGRELSVNGWVERGELVAYGITDREVFPGRAPLGVMRSEIIPPDLPAADVERAVDAARRAARALGLRRGPCYTQVCVSPERAAVFETAARCGGGFDADVTRLVSGVDLYRRVLGVALGSRELEAEGERTPRHPAALVRFLAPPRGEVIEASGEHEARALAGVIDAQLYARPGQHLAGLVNAASRVGHVLCAAPTRAAAVALADAAEQLLVLRVR